jgi:hypothetical protein
MKICHAKDDDIATIEGMVSESLIGNEVEGSGGGLMSWHYPSI